MILRPSGAGQQNAAEKWYNPAMKSLAFLLPLIVPAAVSAMAAAACLALGASAGEARVFPRLPDGTLPDTEVATNVALNVQHDGNMRFSISIDAASCTSNEVLVAVGCDADSDGDLSPDEAAFVYGIENGVRYFVNIETGTASADAPATVTIRARNFNPAWNLAKVVKRGEGSVGETVTTTVERGCFAIRIR